MGWLKQLIDGVTGAPPIDLTFVPSISAADAGIPGIGKAIEPDSCYIELYLESLRLARARRFATRFHGVAYSFVTLSREGEARAQLAAVSTRRLPFPKSSGKASGDDPYGCATVP